MNLAPAGSLLAKNRASMPQMKALTMENCHMVQTECKQSDGTTSETETFIQLAEK